MRCPSGVPGLARTTTRRKLPRRRPTAAFLRFGGIDGLSALERQRLVRRGACSGTEMEEELDVAGGAGEGGATERPRSETAFDGERDDLPQDLVPEQGIADDPSFADP